MVCIRVGAPSRVEAQPGRPVLRAEIKKAISCAGLLHGPTDGARLVLATNGRTFAGVGTRLQSVPVRIVRRRCLMESNSRKGAYAKDEQAVATGRKRLERIMGQRLRRSASAFFRTTQQLVMTTYAPIIKLVPGTIGAREGRTLTSSVEGFIHDELAEIFLSALQRDHADNERAGGGRVVVCMPQDPRTN